MRAGEGEENDMTTITLEKKNNTKKKENDMTTITLEKNNTKKRK